MFMSEMLKAVCLEFSHQALIVFCMYLCQFTCTGLPACVLGLACATVAAPHWLQLWSC